MPGRYVKALIYDVCRGPSVNYDKARPTTLESADFDVRVEDGKATFEFKTKQFERSS